MGDGPDYYLVPMEAIGLPDDMLKKLKRRGFQSVGDCLDLVDDVALRNFIGTLRIDHFETAAIVRYHLIKRGMLSPDDIPVETLGLSRDVINAMERAGIATVGDVITMLDHERDFPSEPRPGRDALITSITQSLVRKGYLPPDDRRVTE